MPNTPVPATGEALPAVKCNRRAIMQTAWARYRHWHAVSERIHGPMPFSRIEFAFKLQVAWGEAKRGVMSMKQRRRDRIEYELDGLKFKSAHINIEPRRRELQTALASLAA